MSKVKAKKSPNSVTQNKKASHEYFIHERFEAGLVLQGWEVKSIRAGRIQLKESYIIVKHGELWLIGTHIPTLKTTSTHIKADPVRTRKLLLHKKQINKLIGSVERKGYTLVPLSLYWQRHHLKIEIALASGKKQHDKRAASKDRDWQREKGRIMREDRK